MASPTSEQIRLERISGTLTEEQAAGLDRMMTTQARRAMRVEPDLGNLAVWALRASKAGENSMGAPDGEHYAIMRDGPFEGAPATMVGIGAILGNTTPADNTDWAPIQAHDPRAEVRPSSLALPERPNYRLEVLAQPGDEAAGVALAGLSLLVQRARELSNNSANGLPWVLVPTDQQHHANQAASQLGFEDWAVGNYAIGTLTPLDTTLMVLPADAAA